ncbi:MAG: sulfatase-like hydrolase/transferase [Verrucomicrobiota bacterium]
MKQLALFFSLSAIVPASAILQAQLERPNIVWICGEDLGAQLSPYGEHHARHANTPNIDRLASQSLTYNIAWSNFPVCRPARTTLAMGMYAESLGGQHMRSVVAPPTGSKMYSQILREAGYETINHGKEDYAVEKTGMLWSSKDDLSNATQPFFMKLQDGKLHEGGIRAKMKELKGENIPRYDLPGFHPDIPEMHRAWHALYRRIEEFDSKIGKWLETMDQQGLLENTIIMIWGDHGPAIARGKRYTRDFGLRVPLIIHIPEKYRAELAPEDYVPGGISDRPVSFVDVGPTMLSLAGIEPPEMMQGEPFMGVYAESPNQYVFGARGRMDERIDMIRTVRDQRYQLMRNYMPHLPYGQHVETLFKNEVMIPWQKLSEAGEIGPPPSLYWEQKPPVELYDLETDPDQIRNLADDPQYRSIRDRLMAALHEHQEAIRDTGFLPEAQIHTRPAKGQSPYDWARSPEYDLIRIRTIAELAAGYDMDAVPKLLASLDDNDPAIQYWGALGLLIRGRNAVSPHLNQLRSFVETDAAPTARVAIAEALVRYGEAEVQGVGLETLLELADAGSASSDQNVALAALNAIDRLDGAALPIYEELKTMKTKSYSKRVMSSTLLPDLEKLVTR